MATGLRTGFNDPREPKALSPAPDWELWRSLLAKWLACLPPHFRSGEVHNHLLKDTLWVERHHNDILSQHRQQSRYLPGLILRKTGQDVYLIQLGYLGFNR